jgi:hypothetical protein
MIILSVGMPRAGSGWYYNLTNELALAAGSQDARHIRRRYHLQSILTEVNCNIGALTPRRLAMVMIPSMLGNTFVIKAHAGPSPFTLRLIQRGALKAAYIYRDPRDAMLSAYENGQKALEKGRPNAFSSLIDFDASLKFVLEYVRISQAWMKIPQALHTCYEDLVNDYSTEAARLVNFLNLDGNAPAIQQVVEKFRPAGAAQTDQKGLHFSKGKTGRFRQKYTPEQQVILAEKLGAYLEEMGYVV